jgi:sugar/nucleoside kinase (ribokinase family)
MTAAPRVIGVTGTAVDDTIEMPDGAVTSDRGGIFYAVITLAALVPPGTRVVPVLGVGEDAFDAMREDFGRLPGVEVDGLTRVRAVNNKVRIVYADGVSRVETLTGGVPPQPLEAFLPWAGRLDAWLWNMISGMEIERETFMDLKSAFEGPIHFDLHSLALHHHHGHARVHRVPLHWEEWVAGVTWVQLNEVEAGLLGSGHAAPVEREDEPALAARLHALGVAGVLVTRGGLGAAYYGADGETVHAPAEEPDAAVDPTGCGDVFGAAWFALRAVRGLAPPAALAGAVRAAGVAARIRGTRPLLDALTAAEIA